MSISEAEALAVQFRDQVRAQRGDTGPVNAFTSTKESRKTMLESGIVLYTDLAYESSYPNAFFDIWYPDDSGKKRPTVLFFHGGGFLFGDKMEGDPLAVGEATDSTVRTELVKNGFNVVSANYALAPEYRFPSQIIQANELFAYLKKAGPELGIFMDDVVIMGSSAGADLTELCGLVISNPTYAAKLGIESALEPSQIRGLVIDEAALDVKRMRSWIVILTKTWLGTDDLVQDEQAVLADAPEHVTGEYPRSYIIASNQDVCFYESAYALHVKLDQANVENRMFFVPASEAELHHGFLTHMALNPVSRKCFEEILTFLEK